MNLSIETHKKISFAIRKKKWQRLLSLVPLNNQYRHLIVKFVNYMNRDGRFTMNERKQKTINIKPFIVWNTEALLKDPNLASKRIDLHFNKSRYITVSGLNFDEKYYLKKQLINNPKIKSCHVVNPLNMAYITVSENNTPSYETLNEIEQLLSFIDIACMEEKWPKLEFSLSKGDFGYHYFAFNGIKKEMKTFFDEKIKTVKGVRDYKSGFAYMPNSIPNSFYFQVYFDDTTTEKKIIDNINQMLMKNNYKTL